MVTPFTPPDGKTLHHSLSATVTPQSQSAVTVTTPSQAPNGMSSEAGSRLNVPCTSSGFVPVQAQAVVRRVAAAKSSNPFSKDMTFIYFTLLSMYCQAMLPPLLPVAVKLISTSLLAVHSLTYR